MNFRFKIRPMQGVKTNIYIRWVARKACKMIYKNKSTHYQFAGWNGTLKKEYVMCNASKFQIMHWLLHIAGYSCCVADIMRRCNIGTEMDEG